MELRKVPGSADGEVVARFRRQVTPDAAEVLSAMSPSCRAKALPTKALPTKPPAEISKDRHKGAASDVTWLQIAEVDVVTNAL